MKKLSLVLLAVALLIGSFFVLNNYIYQEKQSDVADSSVTQDSVVYETYTDTLAGVTFEYPLSPERYIVDDLSEFIAAEDTEVIKVLRVMNLREKIELETSEGGREGPPTISLMVFSNDQRLTASQWVDATPRYSNIDFVIGTIDRDAVAGGANAVVYRTDGLYRSDNVVVAHGAYVYHFSGPFLEEDSHIHQTFKALMDSITFIPTDSMPISEPSSKIDPQAACASALTYMTFENGDQADAFVEACVNGEHPEVIDRYIKDIGLDGASI